MSLTDVIRAVGQVQVKSDHVRFLGGMDNTTPPLAKKPGLCQNALNHEVGLFGGYPRIGGYERYDGHASPSAAIYSIISATITGSPALGNTLVGATSGATGVIIALPGGSFVLTKVVGTYQNGETLNISGSPVATATSVASANSASTSLLNAQYLNLAADQYRSDIAAVTGSGDILGIWVYNDVRYTFRNNAGGTAAVMWKNTASGWSQVSFEYEVTYSAGNGAATIIDGGTLTQGGVTATIRRVLVRTGSLSAGTAAGTMVISVAAGGNFAAGAATVGAGTLTLAGAQTAITLNPSGRFEFVNENFGGSANTTKMYGCDGENPAFEFDGTYFVPIHTGMTTDTPEHITAHKKHLFLGFVGSVQNSSLGNPYGWSVVTGASEIGMGDQITGFAKMPGSEAGSALAVYTRNRTSILYGTSTYDWNLVPYKDELGAYAYTIQDVGQTMFLDDRGITTFQASQAFGNFAHAAISNAIRGLVNDHRTQSVASCISRDKSQYRLFFTGAYALFVTVIGNKIAGIMPITFGHNITCACSTELADGSEVMYFGSDNGMVYQMDKGTSFDGDAISAHIEMAYNFQGNPRVRKRYRNLMLEVSGEGYASITVGHSLGYGDTNISQPSDQTTATSFTPAVWDSFTWDAFVWDGQTLMPTYLPLHGEAENISIVVRSNSDYFSSFTPTGMVINYTPRKLLRT